MKTITLLLFSLLLSTLAHSQDNRMETQRFIKVTGSAEIEVVPDEVRFLIGISEYWKEEFDKKTEFKDYKTKVPISYIEPNLMEGLEKVGISKDQIIVHQVGNSWRYQGKDFLIKKRYELVLDGFDKIESIVNHLNIRGLEYMRIGNLNNQKLTELRKKVKVEALKAAKEKAMYLLESVGEELGPVISVVEIENRSSRFSAPSLSVSNVILPSSGSSDDEENSRMIKLRYEIEATFGIE